MDMKALRASTVSSRRIMEVGYLCYQSFALNCILETGFRSFLGSLFDSYLNCFEVLWQCFAQFPYHKRGELISKHVFFSVSFLSSCEK